MEKHYVQFTPWELAVMEQALRYFEKRCDYNPLSRKHILELATKIGDMDTDYNK